jgi:tRNA A22 N-methylase
MPRAVSRFDVIASLVPEGHWPVVDVGADHGRVAEMVGAIATERAPHRRSAKPLPWVIADGLKPFRHVQVAILTGMGARTIARILKEAPQPSVAVVVHAPDDPILLRQELAALGWKIDEEALAPEAGRFAEVIRAIPGQETAQDATLAFGPRLLRGNDPHLEAHLRQLHAYWSGLASTTKGCAPEKADTFDRYATFLSQVILDRFG